jgi:putative lipoprotein
VTDFTADPACAVRVAGLEEEPMKTATDSPGRASRGRRTDVMRGGPAVGARMAVLRPILRGGVAAALAAAFAAPALAQTNPWAGSDKALHAGISAPLGMIGASIAGGAASAGERVLYGTMLGSLPGLAKELVDAQRPGGDASYRDMAFNVVGAALGALLADCCLIRPYMRGDRLDGIGVEYRIDF